MRWPNMLLKHFTRFGICYAILIIPWPGFSRAYAAGFRAAGRLLAPRESSPWVVSFEAAGNPASPLDTRILVANRRQAAPDGRCRAVALDLDTRSIGWIPTALLLALLVATPAPFSVHLRETAAGFLIMQGYVAAAVWAHIVFHADAASGLALARLSPLESVVFAALDETLIRQLGTGFVLAAAIWMVFALRRRDIWPGRGNWVESRLAGCGDPGRT